MNVNHDSKILVCIPAFNEAETIAEIISKSKKYADHIIVYDDGSTDNTKSRRQQEQWSLEILKIKATELR